jgi:hypothetical protein
VGLINARAWINDEKAFLDSHHLMKDGGDRFTERLGHEGLAPLLPTTAAALTRNAPSEDGGDRP